MSDADQPTRYQQGLRVLDKMSAGAFDGDLNPALAELKADFPFLVEAVASYAIGDVWSRPQLDDRTRELAMIAALGVVGAGAAAQLRQHIGYALTLGVDADQLRELVYLTTVSAGFPRALNMAAHMSAIFAERGVEGAGEEPGPPIDRHQRGIDKMDELGRERVDIAAHPVLGPLHRQFPFLIDGMVEYAMGDVWTRPALAPATRQIATVAAFGALGDAWPQVRLHAGHALRLGVSPAMLAEVVNVLTVAVGFPTALNAASELHAVFRPVSC